MKLGHELSISSTHYTHSAGEYVFVKSSLISHLLPDTERGETFRLKHEELGTEDGARAGVDWCELDISRYCCLVPGVQDRG